MAHANPYIPKRSFSDDATSNVSGRSGVNATSLDNELLRVSESINRIINNQKLLQRDDGRLGDTVVEVHTLSREVLMLLGNYHQRGSWLAQTSYTSGDVVTHDILMYVCKTSHVSDSAFIESPNWLQFGFAGSAEAAQAAAQATSAATQAANSAASAQSSATTATTKASNANTSAQSAASSANSAQTASESASNSAAQATSANNAAQAAAAQATSANNAAQAAAAVAQSAAQVGGISNERIIYGDDASKTSAVTSADLATASGFFESSSDVPSTGKWLIVNVKSKSGSERVQYAYKADNPSEQYTRGIIGANKTQWVPIWNGGNLNFESIAFTGTPTAPTAAVGTNTTQIATTAFVNAGIAADRPFEATLANIKMDGAQSVGSLNTVARGDHVHPTDTTRAAVASFANSKSSNGWQKLEGGLIIQWGTVGFAANNSTTVQATVAFPIAFPSECVHISGVQTSRASNDGGGTWAMRPTNKTLTNFSAMLDNNGGSALYNFKLPQTAEWIAIGY